MPDKRTSIKIGVLGAPHVGKTALLNTLVTSLTSPDTVPLRLEYGARIALRHRYMYLVWESHACELFTHSGDQKDVAASLRLMLEEALYGIWMVRLDNDASDERQHEVRRICEALLADRAKPLQRQPTRWCVLFHGDLERYGNERATALVPAPIRHHVLAAYHVPDLAAPTASHEIFALLDGLLGGKAD